MTTPVTLRFLWLEKQGISWTNQFGISLPGTLKLYKCFNATCIFKENPWINDLFYKCTREKILSTHIKHKNYFAYMTMLEKWNITSIMRGWSSHASGQNHYRRSQRSWDIRKMKMGNPYTRAWEMNFEPETYLNAKELAIWIYVLRWDSVGVYKGHPIIGLSRHVSYQND